MTVTELDPAGSSWSAADDVPRPVVVRRGFGDRVFRGLAVAAGGTTFLVMGLIGLFLAVESRDALAVAGVGFFTESAWLPSDEPPVFGIAALLYWTVVIAVIALVLAVPVAIGTALFINEYAPRWLRGSLTGLVDLLAAVPSLVYGMWGFYFLQPRLIGLSGWLADHLAFVPVFKVSTDKFASSAFVAGVVVSLMVVPIVTSVVREVFSQAPQGEKEAALALGGSRWGMIRSVVLPFGRGGIVGGSMLGLGRALGETIAVALIISPVFEISPRILEQGANSVAAHIALRFGEASGVALSALIAAGLALFFVTLVVNSLSTIVVARSRSGHGIEL